MLQSMGSQSQTWLSNWTTNPLLGSYPEISLLCWIYFEHGGNYLQGNSGAQEANRHFTVAFFTWGPPNIWQTFPLTCLWSLVLQIGAKLLGAAHHHTASRLWNPCRIVILFLPLESPSSLSVSSPMGFHVPFLYCLSLLQKRSVFFFIISPHVRGWEPGCVCQMHCVALTPAVPCLMIWYLGERETVRRKICSVPWTLGFGHFSWRQSLAASFLILTSLFSGQEINLYTKTQGFVSRCLRGSFGPQWSFLGEFVISLGIGLNASGLRFSFEVYFMFCCGFQISHGLDLGK